MKCERWTRNCTSCSRRLRRKKVDEIPLADGFLFSTKGHNPLRYPSAGTKMLQLSAFRLPVVQLSQSFTAFHRFTHRIFPIAWFNEFACKANTQKKIQSAWGCHKTPNHWYYILTMSNVIPKSLSANLNSTPHILIIMFRSPMSLIFVVTSADQHLHSRIFVTPQALVSHRIHLGVGSQTTNTSTSGWLGFGSLAGWSFEGIFWNFGGTSWCQFWLRNGVFLFF